MSLIRQLSVLAVCQILGDRADSLLGFVGERFQDHGTRLEMGLVKSNERAWRCLEVALAGDSFWDSCKAMVTARDEQTLQRQIRAFLASLPAAELPPGDALAFRKLALADLKGARKVGLVPGIEVSCRDVAGDHARVFARYGDPQGLIERDRKLLEGIAGTLQKEGYVHLARYVSLRPAGGQPLLVQAVRYFFRREVEADERLAAGLTLEKLDGLDAGMKAGLDGLHEALSGQLGTLLEGVQEVGAKVTATMEVVTGTRDDVKRLEVQLEQQGEELRQLTAMLRQMLEQKPAPVATAGAAGVQTKKARDDKQAGSPDWAQVRQLLGRAQRVTPQQQRPDVARVADQLAEAAEHFETTRRTYDQARQAEASAGPLPTLPAGETLVPRPAAQNRLISDIFLTQQPAAQEPAAPAAKTEQPDSSAKRKQERKRLLSPLFDPEQGKK